MTTHGDLREEEVFCLPSHLQWMCHTIKWRHDH